MLKPIAQLLLVSATMVSLPAIADTNICKVTDPTGAALNVRDDVNGRVISKIPNDKEVKVLDNAQDMRGRPWVYVSYKVGKQTRSGWIFREFISCY